MFCMLAEWMNSFLLCIFLTDWQYDDDDDDDDEIQRIGSGYCFITCHTCGFAECSSSENIRYAILSSLSKRVGE
jgi:hypothetical protein